MESLLIAILLATPAVAQTAARPAQVVTQFVVYN
jgi:hypothetical protein